MRSLLALLALASPAYAQDLPDCGLYLYAAHIERVIDGDTVVADIDLGFNIVIQDESLRLNGIDAPKAGTPGAARATEELRRLVEGRDIHICTVKMKRSDREAKGSFHRYLAELYVDGINVNAWLLDRGLAVQFDR